MKLTMASATSSLAESMRQLSLLGADPVAKRGLRVLLQESRRCGLDAVQVGGITITSLRSAESVSQPPQNRTTGRRKSEARRMKDAEAYRERRMRRKLLAVLPIVNRVMMGGRGALVEEPPATAPPPDAEAPPSTPPAASRPKRDTDRTPPARDGGITERKPAGSLLRQLSEAVPDCTNIPLPAQQLAQAEELCLRYDAGLRESLTSRGVRYSVDSYGSTHAYVTRVLEERPQTAVPALKPLGAYIETCGPKPHRD